MTLLNAGSASENKAISGVLRIALKRQSKNHSYDSMVSSLDNDWATVNGRHRAGHRAGWWRRTTWRNHVGSRGINEECRSPTADRRLPTANRQPPTADCRSPTTTSVFNQSYLIIFYLFYHVIFYYFCINTSVFPSTGGAESNILSLKKQIKTKKIIKT